MTEGLPASEAPVPWRNLRFVRHSPGVWITNDRLWKLTNTAGEAHWVAYLQLDPNIFFVESAETPALALERLAQSANGYALKIGVALEQARFPSELALL